MSADDLDFGEDSEDVPEEYWLGVVDALIGAARVIPEPYRTWLHEAGTATAERTGVELGEVKS